MAFAKPILTRNGYQFNEVASALQKCVRRGLLDEALFWAVELYLSGFGEYCWKRLRIMSSEDVGGADPHLTCTIRALYDNYVDQVKKKDTGNQPERLFLVHAVVLLCEAPKNRRFDDALIYHFGNHDRLATERKVPDFALDKHTQAGRRLRRGWQHFFDEGTKLEREQGENEYRELARQTALRGADITPAVGRARREESTGLFA